MMAINPVASPYPPPYVPKERGWNFLPPNTVEIKLGAGWGVYYNQFLNWSFLVSDTITGWRVNTIPGRVKLSYATGVLKHKKQMMQAAGCCGEDG